MLEISFLNLALLRVRNYVNYQYMYLTKLLNLLAINMSSLIKVFTYQKGAPSLTHSHSPNNLHVHIVCVPQPVC